MSFYNDSNIFCGQGNQIDYNQVFKLADLYFCPNCQCPKSKLQTSYKIEQKFCPNCLQDFSSSLSTCNKNCFTCPKCNGHVIVSVIDHVQGKSFKFNCTYCPYDYVTQVILKPKSLLNIIKQEKLANDEFSNIFSKFKLSYEGKDTSNIGEKSDKVKENLKLSGLLQDSVQKLELNSSNDTFPLILFPLSRTLSSKRSRRCLDCNTLLVSPKPNLPTVNKFDVNFVALDYLPTIKVVEDKSHDGEDCKYLMSFINPLNSPVDISIQWNNTSVNIPITKFTTAPSNSLGSQNTIKKIPTSWLTKNTTTSKAELILRKNEDIQFGNNWYQIPIFLQVDQEILSNTIKLPLYITVSTDVPDLFKNFNKPKLNFGYWNIIELPIPRSIQK